MSAEDYLVFEETAQVKHEFVNGRLFAMTGASTWHNIISLNIALSLRSQLKDSGCAVYIADVKVRVETANSFYYPDVMVDCQTSSGSHVFTSSPSIIFEVLSPSTASTDRREKLNAYSQIPTLTAYVLVHQTKRQVEVFIRDSDDFLVQELIHNDKFAVELCPNQSVQLRLEDIFENIDFDSSDLKVREESEIYSW